VLLLHDNAPAHTACIATSAATGLLPHSPYSPDLAPSDYSDYSDYLFPKQKEHLRGSQHTCVNDVIEAVEEFLADDTAFYQTGIEMHQKCQKTLFRNNPPFSSAISSSVFVEILAILKGTYLTIITYIQVICCEPIGWEFATVASCNMPL